MIYIDFKEKKKKSFEKKKEKMIKVDLWMLIGVGIMSALLLFSIAQVNKIDDKISECNEYWINIIGSGRVDYYDETPDNFSLNSSLFIKEDVNPLEIKNDY